jgi:anti-repressor protein
MNNLDLFKNQQIIPLKENENGEVLVSARDLHEFLEIRTDFRHWFPRMCGYGFEENEDYTPVIFDHPLNNQPTKDYAMKIDMAKEIAMIQRSRKGKMARKYFIEVEKAWNSPEMIMKRALEIANKKVDKLSYELEVARPKAMFADSVFASESTILIRDLAKILKGNGIDIGEKRLFVWMRENGYLIKQRGRDYNSPTQKAMNMGLFRIKENTITHSNGKISINKTPLVTGKGQTYFIKKFFQQMEGLKLKLT